MNKDHPEIVTAAIGKEIHKATGKSVVDFQINFPPHELVSITMTYYPDAEELAKLACVFGKYEESQEKHMKVKVPIIKVIDPSKIIVHAEVTGVMRLRIGQWIGLQLVKLAARIAHTKLETKETQMSDRHSYRVKP